MSNLTIVVSATHLKNIIAIAEQNAVEDVQMSPAIEITLISKAEFPTAVDTVKIHQLSYSPNQAPKLIGY